MAALVTKWQGILSTSLLLCLCVVTAPLSAAAVLLATLRTGLRVQSHVEADDVAQKGRKTALINGGRMQKSLFVARALSKRGFRVVLVEERGWGEACAARFSKAVFKFRTVPCGGGKAYIDALVQVAAEENVNLFVPCSGAGTTVEDARAGERMRRELGIVAVIQTYTLAQALHEKDLFISLARRNDFDTPASALVRSPEEAIALLKQPGQAPMLLKAASVLDDVGRSDMTTYPLRSSSGQIDWALTETKLREGLHVPLTEKSPYIVQEFIGGNGASEWCTHATVIEGKNDMLMTYIDMTQSSIGRRAQKWTQDFIDKLDCIEPSGHFSFDFIHQPETDRLVVLECNPRVHTAVCLLSSRAEELGGVLEGAMASSNDPVVPAKDAYGLSWLGHDVVARLVPPYVPAAIRRAIHPLWTPGEGSHSGQQEIIDRPGQMDAAWDWSDPMPFFGLYHLQWPQLLLRQLLVRRRAWSRINLSTARIFETSF